MLLFRERCSLKIRLNANVNKVFKAYYIMDRADTRTKAPCVIYYPGEVLSRGKYDEYYYL